MAQNASVNKGIKNHWSLIAFARLKGPTMQVGQFKMKDSPDVFHSCIFTDSDGERTFVSFSSKMGELTPQDISKMRNELQVVQLESGNYSLCKVGSTSWVDVDLGL